MAGAAASRRPACWRSPRSGSPAGWPGPASAAPLAFAAVLVVRGTGASGRTLARAVTRHHWPLALAAAAVSRRARRGVLAVAVVDAVAAWWPHRQRVGPVRFAAARRLEDLAYGAGLWGAPSAPATRGRSSRPARRGRSLTDTPQPEWLAGHPTCRPSYCGSSQRRPRDNLTHEGPPMTAIQERVADPATDVPADPTVPHLRVPHAPR